MRVQIPPTERGTFEADICRPLQRTYAGECACAAHEADECIRCREMRRDIDAAFCQITLNTCLFYFFISLPLRLSALD